MIDGWQQVVVGAVFLGLLTIGLFLVKFRKSTLHFDSVSKDVSKEHSCEMLSQETSVRPMTDNDATGGAIGVREAEPEGIAEANSSLLWQEILKCENSVEDPWIRGMAMDLLPRKLLLKIFGFLDRDELILISEVNKLFHTMALSPSLWKRDFEVMLVSNYDDPIFGQESSASRFKVPMVKLNSLTLFLHQMSYLKVMKLEFINTYDNNVVADNFDIHALSNLRCLTLSASRLSVIPVKVTLPSSLKHFSLIAYGRGKSIGRTVNDILSVVHQCCPELEHISIDLSSTSFVSLRKPFRGFDYIFRNAKKTIRSAVVRDSLFSKSSLSTKFMHRCKNLEALCIHVNGDIDFTLNSLNGGEDLIMVSNILSETKHKKLQMLGLYGVMNVGSSSAFFDKRRHVYSNIRLLCIYNLHPDFKTFAKCFPNLLVLYIGNVKRPKNVDGLVNFIRKCLSLRQIGFRSIYWDQESVQKLVRLKEERPSLEYFSDELFDFLIRTSATDEILSMTLSDSRDRTMKKRTSDHFKDIKTFKFDNFLGLNNSDNSSGCFSDVCENLKGLLDQLQSS